MWRKDFFVALLVVKKATGLDKKDRQRCRLIICSYIGWIEKYCIYQFNEYIYKYWDGSAVWKKMSKGPFQYDKPLTNVNLRTRCGNWVSLKCVIVSRRRGISENVKEYVISAGPPRSPATKVNYSRLFAPSERWRRIIKKAPGVFHQTRTSWNRACNQEQSLSIPKVIICNIFQSHQSLH